jgi:hypothetical protein
MVRVLANERKCLIKYYVNLTNYFLKLTFDNMVNTVEIDSPPKTDKLFLIVRSVPHSTTQLS